MEKETLVRSAHILEAMRLFLVFHVTVSNFNFDPIVSFLTVGTKILSVQFSFISLITLIHLLTQ